MKLTVTSASASPAGVWQRFAGVAIDHALAAGEEIVAAGVRAVCGDDAISRHASGLAISIDANANVADVLAEFDQRSAAWPIWWTAGSSDDLPRHGYRQRESSLLKLKAARAAAADVEGVIILPGRAARSAVEAWADERARDDAAAFVLPRHADDPQYESIVAIKQGLAIAIVGLQTRGQVGLVCDVFVRPEERLRGLASLLLARAVELAARGQLTDVFAAAPVDDPAAVPTLRRAGFDNILPFTAWQPPAGR